MKNIFKIILILAGVLFLLFVGIKTFSQEDSWICENGQWIPHGKPYGPKPTSACAPRACQLDTDCQTPMEFLVQSNCPFGSACINNECKVICPLYESSCTQDSDCNCDQRGTKTRDCICHKSTCVSIEG